MGRGGGGGRGGGRGRGGGVRGIGRDPSRHSIKLRYNNQFLPFYNRFGPVD